MCGISGVLRRDARPLDTAEEPILRRMARQVAYRGPDDEQIVREGPMGMAFRRLSIVDLDGGRQPMTNEDGSLHLMVNGEIYNHRALRRELRDEHRFGSESDSEIVLHLYEERGPEALELLNGMFALALWDARRRRLLLARDRLGIKPLYYHLSRERLIFGSEIKAVLAHPDCPRELDWKQALEHSATEYLDIPERRPCSFFRGVKYLPAGHRLLFDLGSQELDVAPYWTLRPLSPDEYEADRRTSDEIVDGYRELLEDSVRLRLMADVELGVFLSGGLDSTAVTEIAARQQSFHTFTVLSQSTLANGDARAAHDVTRELDLPNHQVRFEWHDLPFTPADWKRLVWLLETPLCQAEQLYKYQLHRFVRRCRPDLKVILLGQGSDEFNGGYSTFWIEHMPEPARSWSTFLEHWALKSERRALRARGGGERLAEWDLWRRDGRPALPMVRREYLASLAGHEPWRHPWHYMADSHRFTLQMYNNWHEDRTAAGNSIENRVPFLDHRLVEYLNAVPPRFHEELFWEKRILRRAMAGSVSEGLVERPKVGFFHGVDTRYTYRMMYDLLVADDRRLLREAFPDEHPVVDRTALHRAFDELPEDPEYGHLPQLLRLVNLGLLEQLVRDVPALADMPETMTVLEEADGTQFDEAADELQLDLASRRDIDLDRALALGETIQLVRSESPEHDGGIFYLAVDDKLQYELERSEMAPWIEVLRRLDGKRSLAGILDETGIAEADIRKHLEEALDYDVVSFV